MVVSSGSISVCAQALSENISVTMNAKKTKNERKPNGGNDDGVTRLAEAPRLVTGLKTSAAKPASDRLSTTGVLLLEKLTPGSLHPFAEIE